MREILIKGLGRSAYNELMYMLAPLAEHYDDSFGAVADAFRDAAKTLREANGGKKTFDLPMGASARGVPAPPCD